MKCIFEIEIHDTNNHQKIELKTNGKHDVSTSIIAKTKINRIVLVQILYFALLKFSGQSQCIGGFCLFFLRQLNFFLVYQDLFLYVLYKEGQFVLYSWC